MPTVAILAFPGVQALDVTGPMDVFSEANHYLEPPHQYRLTLLGTEAGLCAWLRQTAGRAARVASICNGAFCWRMPACWITGARRRIGTTCRT